MKPRRYDSQTIRYADVDFAQALKDLSDTQIILVQDNFNTDKPASFYEVSPVLGRRLVERCYTPEHGNWLNCTPKSGPPGALVTPGGKCSCTM